MRHTIISRLFCIFLCNYILVGSLEANSEAVAKVIKENPLIHEIGQTRLEIEKLHRGILEGLKESLLKEKGDFLEPMLEELKIELQSHIEKFSDESLSVDVNSNSLREAYKDYLEWQSDEMIQNYREAYMASLTAPLGSEERKALLVEKLSIIEEEEGSRLERLKFHMIRSLSRSGIPKHKTVGYELGRLAGKLVFFLAVVGLFIWILVKRSKSDPRAQAYRAYHKEQSKKSDDLY